MEKFDILFSRTPKPKREEETPKPALSKTEDSPEESLDDTERRLLLEKREAELSTLTSIRKQMEIELENAKKSGDFTKFYEIHARAKATVLAISSMQRKYEGEKFPEDITATYDYMDESEREIVKELKEISFNFETILAFNQDFYNKHGVELPESFEEIMMDIWERNSDEIFLQVEQKGFDKMIFIPESVDEIDLTLFEAKMTDHYEKEKGNKTYWGINASVVKSGRSGNRIVLLHQADDLTSHPELKKTLGTKYGGEKTNGEDNKAEDFVKSGESMTIQEWLVFQRQIQIEKGVHVDGKLTPDGSYIYATWLPGSKAGSEVVYAYWHPGLGQVRVYSYTPDRSSPNFGCRLSRCFQ
jgi:hypothetical protein